MLYLQHIWIKLVYGVIGKLAVWKLLPAADFLSLGYGYTLTASTR